MELTDRIKDRVIDQANQSEGRFKLGAIGLDARGNLVTHGNNKEKTHPLQAEYAKKAKQPKKISLHAEIDALIRANNDVSILIVARINKRGELRSAKPCQVCQLAIEQAGVEEVWFSTDHGFEKYEV